MQEEKSCDTCSHRWSSTLIHLALCISTNSLCAGKSSPHMNTPEVKHLYLVYYHHYCSIPQAHGVLTATRLTRVAFFTSLGQEYPRSHVFFSVTMQFNNSCHWGWTHRQHPLALLLAFVPMNGQSRPAIQPQLSSDLFSPQAANLSIFGCTNTTTAPHSNLQLKAVPRCISNHTLLTLLVQVQSKIGRTFPGHTGFAEFYDVQIDSLSRVRERCANETA